MSNRPRTRKGRPPRGSRDQLAQQERVVRAIGMRTAGMTYAAIAEALGYYDAATCRKAILRETERTPREATEVLAATQDARLEALLAMAWRQAEAGDLKAMETALKIVQARGKLHGLDVESAPAPAAGGSGPGNVFIVGGQTTIVGRDGSTGDPVDPAQLDGGSYLAGLQALAGMPGAPALLTAGSPVEEDAAAAVEGDVVDAVLVDEPEPEPVAVLDVEGPGTV